MWKHACAAWFAFGALVLAGFSLFGKSAELPEIRCPAMRSRSRDDIRIRRLGGRYCFDLVAGVPEYGSGARIDLPSSLTPAVDNLQASHAMVAWALAG